jgi:hypothetical protein
VIKKVLVIITHKLEAVETIKMSANVYKTREDEVVKDSSSEDNRLTLYFPRQ